MPRHKKVQFTGGLILGICMLLYVYYSIMIMLWLVFSPFLNLIFSCNTMHRALKFASRKARGFLLLMYLKMMITVQHENFTVFEALNLSCSLINCPCN